MPAITIDLNRIARTFTRGTTVLATWLRWTGTTRILALVLIVRHGNPPGKYLVLRGA
jgi:hypothetical protein